MTKTAFERMKQELEEHDPWLKGANLDTRGLALTLRNGLPKEESFVDEQFGQTMVLENRESLKQALGQIVGSNDTEVNSILRAAGIENPNEPKTFNLPGGYVGRVVRRSDGSYLCAVQMPDGTRRRFISKRGAEEAAMLAAKRLTESEIRPLTAEELRTVAWMAKENAGMAAAKYVACALKMPDDLWDKRGIQPVLADPKYANLINEATFFAWSHSRHDYDKGDKQFPIFLDRFCGQGEPRTIPTIDAAFEAYKKQQTTATIKERFAEQEPTPEEIERGLNDMDDAEMNRQFWQTAKHIARGARA